MKNQSIVIFNISHAVHQLLFSRRTQTSIATVDMMAFITSSATSKGITYLDPNQEGAFDQRIFKSFLRAKRKDGEF